MYRMHTYPVHHISYAIRPRLVLDDFDQMREASSAYQRGVSRKTSPRPLRLMCTGLLATSVKMIRLGSTPLLSNGTDNSRRRQQGKDLVPGPLGVAIQVDGNLDLIRADFASNVANRPG
ncbi:MAG: hypothetical protein FRX49_09416 [Trebouxia sp. A1-2]|nr:MAG: hypothetical protein FRX49_09416 [Trebouxia sp. A1-2]